MFIEKESLSSFIIPSEKYLVTSLGAGSTQNVFHTQQCNFGERGRGK